MGRLRGQAEAGPCTVRLRPAAARRRLISQLALGLGLNLMDLSLCRMGRSDQLIVLRV